MPQLRPASTALATCGSLAALLALAIGVPAAAGASDDGIASKPVVSEPDPNIDPVTGINLSNLHLVESLDPLGKCLFDYGVFPRGGVGVPDSGLPYGDVRDPSSAYMTLRAEVLRELSASVAGVTWDGDTGAPTTVTIAVKAGSLLASRIQPEGFVANSAPGRAALASLRNNGLAVVVAPDAISSMADMCGVNSFLQTDEVRQRLAAALDAARGPQEPDDPSGVVDEGSGEIWYWMVPDGRDGVYRIEANPALVAPLRDVLSIYGDAVSVREFSF